MTRIIETPANPDLFAHLIVETPTVTQYDLQDGGTLIGRISRRPDTTGWWVWLNGHGCIKRDGAVVYFASPEAALAQVAAERPV